MKNTVIKLLLDAKGRINSVVVGLVVGSVTKLLASKNLTLDPAAEDLLSTTVGLVVMWAIDSIVLKLQTDGVKRIQEVLPDHVVNDGIPGEVTVRAVETAVSNSP